MKVILINIFIFCFQAFFHKSLTAQEFIVNDSNGRLARVDLNGCVDSQIANIGSFTDIAAHPNGNYYAIRPTGELFKVDLVNIGVFQVAKFQGNNFYALTAGSDGTIFAASGGGTLASYNPNDDKIKTYPPIGTGASGDLTFYKGQLYLATTDNTLLSIYPNNPENNQVIIDFSSANAEIFGIVSTVVGCEIKTYAISGDNRARIFEIGWEDKSFTQVCEADIRIYGGSSEYEYKASKDGLYIEHFSKSNTLCSDADVTVKLFGKGFGDRISYSLDGINFQEDNSFEGLSFGKHKIYMKDNLGCVGTDSIVLNPGNLEVKIDKLVDDNCSEGNGKINLNIETEADNFFVNLNGKELEESIVFENLMAGDYSFDIRDTDGCNEKFNIEIKKIQKSKFVSILTNDADCGDYNGAIRAEINNQNGQYFLEERVNLDGIFENLEPKGYNLIVLDGNGCKIDTFLLVNAVNDCNLFIPNIFSPNEDGINDIFVPLSDNPKEIKQMIIFDRWGSVVYVQKNRFTDDSDFGWDGSINGRKANEDTYLYSIELVGKINNLIFTGDLSLKR